MTTSIYDVNTLDLVHNGSYEITSKPKAKYGLPYTMVLGAEYASTILLDLSDNSRKMLYTLIQNRNLQTNEVQYRVQGAKDKCKLTRAYKELNSKGLVKRIRNTWYMINPKAVIPRFENYKNLAYKWSIL